jgi:hypothetical protein
MGSEVQVRVLGTLPELEEIRREWESLPGNRDSDIHSYLMYLRSNPERVRRHALGARFVFKPR